VTLVASQGSIIGLYHFDSTSGNIAFDDSNFITDSPNDGVIYGHGNNGWIPAGKKNGCFNFGTGNIRGYITNRFTDKLDFSISFWMFTTKAGKVNDTTQQWWAGEGIVDADLGGYNADFGLGLLGKQIAFGCGPTDTSIVSKSPVTDGSWHQVVATRQVVDTNNIITLYIDGKKDASLSMPYNTQLRVGEFISIGSSNSNDRFYSGILDELIFFDYALIEADVLQRYNADLRWSPTNPNGVENPFVTQTVGINVKDFNSTAIAIFFGVLCFVLIVVIAALLSWHSRNKKSGAYASQVDRQ